jgi:ubiquinone biosynthesis protein UbiJ
VSRSVARRSKGRSSRGVYGSLLRFVPFASMAGLGTLAAVDGPAPLAVLFGIGAVVSGRRLLDRRRNVRKELRRRARANATELGRVARTDSIAAPQMKRIITLQDGFLESWELLPEEYGPLLLEDLYTVVDEVEASAQLARRRSALRRHLDSVDRRAIVRRIRDLEREVSTLEEDSALRSSFGAALEGRRGELAVHDEIPRAIGLINAQLEGIESLLGNLRGELLALDASPAAISPESRLVGLKQRVAYFLRSLDEVKRSVDRLPGDPSDALTETLPERMSAR